MTNFKPVGRQEQYRVIHELGHATRALKSGRVVGYSSTKDPNTGLKTVSVTYSTEYTHDKADNICQSSKKLESQ